MKAKGGHFTIVTYSEAKALINIDQFWKELEEIVNDQKEFFIHHVTLRYLTRPSTLLGLNH